MIIRAIKDNPEEELKHFDYFNDYKDTIRFCVRMGLDDIVEKLDKGHQEWLEQRRNENKS